MLDLKTMVKNDKGLEAVYTVTHSSEQFKTTLTQDLHVTICPRTGKVKGMLLIEDLEAPSLAEAVARLAIWCDRLAEALREPMKIVTGVPVFERDREAEALKFEQEGSQGMTWVRLKALAGALHISEPETYKAANALYQRGYITYPLSNVEFLPELAKDDVPYVLGLIEQVLPGQSTGFVLNEKSPIFSKLFPYAHTAIIPAFDEDSTDNVQGWTPAERAVYRIVAEAYVQAVHLPPPAASVTDTPNTTAQGR